LFIKTDTRGNKFSFIYKKLFYLLIHLKKMKTLKISALALAVLAVFGFVLNTQAQSPNAQVSITIDAGTNSCTLDPYAFSNTGVSATEKDL
jgi:hypothetical protein